MENTNMSLFNVHMRHVETAYALRRNNPAYEKVYTHALRRFGYSVVNSVLQKCYDPQGKNAGQKTTLDNAGQKTTLDISRPIKDRDKKSTGKSKTVKGTKSNTDCNGVNPTIRQLKIDLYYDTMRLETVDELLSENTTHKRVKRNGDIVHEPIAVFAGREKRKLIKKRDKVKELFDNLTILVCSNETDVELSEKLESVTAELKELNHAIHDLELFGSDPLNNSDSVLQVLKNMSDGDALDLVTVAMIAITEQLHRCFSHFPVCGLESPYEIRKPSKSVLTFGNTDTVTFETVVTSGVLEIFKAVRRAVDNSKAVVTNPRNGYLYLSLFDTSVDGDVDGDTASRIYKRMPRFADFGEYTDNTVKSGLYTSSCDTEKAHDLLDKIMSATDKGRKLTDRQKTILTYRVQGDGYKTIAKRLHVSNNAVVEQVKAIQRKVMPYLSIDQLNKYVAVKDYNNGNVAVDDCVIDTTDKSRPTFTNSLKLFDDNAGHDDHLTDKVKAYTKTVLRNYCKHGHAGHGNNAVVERPSTSTHRLANIIDTPDGMVKIYMPIPKKENNGDVARWLAKYDYNPNRNYPAGYRFFYTDISVSDERIMHTLYK